jgi:hypothetical protein
MIPSLGFQSGGVLVAISEWDLHATQALTMLINLWRTVLYSIGQRSRVLWRSPGGDLSVESTLHWHNLTSPTIAKPYPSPTRPRRDAARSVRDSVTPGTDLQFHSRTSSIKKNLGRGGQMFCLSTKRTAAGIDAEARKWSGELVRSKAIQARRAL